MDQDLNLPIRIGIAEDEDVLRETLGISLAQGRREILLFANGKEIVESLQKGRPFDIIIADLMMPEVDGLQVLKKAKEVNAEGLVILMTGYASLDTAIEAIRGGAYDYIRKPFKLEELEMIVNNACEKISLLRENRLLHQKLKESIEEMKGLRKTPDHKPITPSALPSPTLDHKIAELSVLLNQMIPPDYDFKKREHREKTMENLERLIQLRKEGFINEEEFNSAKKMLLMPFQD